MAEMPLDIGSNRRAQKWTARELMGRLLWEMLGARLFAWSPRLAWPWRCWILRLFGAQIGRAVHINQTVRIAVPWNLTVDDNVGIGDRVILYSLGPIHVQRDATISQNAHLCAGTHDFRRPDMLLVKPPIVVGEAAWICADAYLGPGVTIGAKAVVGARAVVVNDVAPSIIVAGNPAKQVGER